MITNIAIAYPLYTRVFPLGCIGVGNGQNNTWSPPPFLTLDECPAVCASGRRPCPENWGAPSPSVSRCRACHFTRGKPSCHGALNALVLRLRLGLRIHAARYRVSRASGSGAGTPSPAHHRPLGRACHWTMTTCGLSMAGGGSPCGLRPGWGRVRRAGLLAGRQCPTLTCRWRGSQPQSSSLRSTTARSSDSPVMHGLWPDRGGGADSRTSMALSRTATLTVHLIPSPVLRLWPNISIQQEACSTSCAPSPVPSGLRLWLRPLLA